MTILLSASQNPKPVKALIINYAIKNAIFQVAGRQSHLYMDAIGAILYFNTRRENIKQQ